MSAGEVLLVIIAGNIQYVNNSHGSNNRDVTSTNNSSTHTTTTCTRSYTGSIYTDNFCTSLQRSHNICTDIGCPDRSPNAAPSSNCITHTQSHFAAINYTIPNIPTLP